MPKDIDRLDLTDRQKTRLLNLALGPADSPEPANDDEARGDLLHDLLRCSLPPRDGPSKGIQAATTVALSLRSIVGPPIGELLLDPLTSVNTLKGIKQYAKARGTGATSDQERDVFLAVYFAAIAAARLHHGMRITEHAEADLVRFLSSFERARWVPRDLRALFQKAVACRRQQMRADAQ